MLDKMKKPLFNSLFFGLLLCVVTLLISAEAVKVTSTENQSVVSQLLTETEKGPSSELSKIINTNSDEDFSLEDFNDWITDFMVDMFEGQSTEDSMYNVISYKCDKNLQSYSFQVSYDETDLERVLNNKALCSLQETLAEGDLDTSNLLTEHMQNARGGVSALQDARESYYTEMYDVVNSIISQVEEAEEQVEALLNGMDSSDVLSAMIQLRATSKQILMQTAKNGGQIDKGLALVQSLSKSSGEMSSYDLVAIQEMLSEMKEDVIEMVYTIQEDEESETETLATQSSMIDELITELLQESSDLQSTISMAEECVETNESDEATLTETLQMEIEKLEDFECLCDLMTEKYDYINAELNYQQGDLQDIEEKVDQNQSLLE